MGFCSNCGGELPEGVKYCPHCGAPSANGTGQREVKYEGKIHKCPNCGETLGAFVAVCPSCGYELRGVSASSAVSAFARKIEELEHPSGMQRGNLRAINKMGARARSKQIISLIRNFVIPNTKEELLEFLILASSNINMERYDTSRMVSGMEKEISDAWESMFEQAYKKAQISFGNTTDFSLFSSVYNEKKEKIEKQQKKSKVKSTLSWVLLLVFSILMITVGIICLKSTSKDDDKIIKEENNRLDAIAQEVYSYIDEENYTMARAKLTELVFDLSKSSSYACEKAAEKWRVTREELTDIIDEAEAGQSVNSSTP